MAHLEIIPKNRILFSQHSISGTFHDGTSVNSWCDCVPFACPINVLALDDGNYLSLDNRRLFSATTYGRPNLSLSCNVYRETDEIPDEMENIGLSMLYLMWQDGANVTHKVALRMSTVGAVFYIRCVRQSSDFPANGSATRPVIGRPVGRIDQVKIENVRGIIFGSCPSNFLDCLLAAETVYVQPDVSVNIYHPRADVAAFVATNFASITVVEHNVCSNVVLKARGPSGGGGSWDEWDDMNAAVLENDLRRLSIFEDKFYDTLKLFIQVIPYNLEGLSRDEEVHFVDGSKSALVSQFTSLCPRNKLLAVECGVGDSIDFIIFTAQPIAEVDFPSSISCNTFDLNRGSPISSPTLELDITTKGDIVSNIGVGVEKLVVSTGEHSIQVSCSFDLKERVKMATKQCFGYSKSLDRCCNRRVSVGLAWCRHHESQKTEYDSLLRSDAVPMCSFIPPWWL